MKNKIMSTILLALAAYFLVGGILFNHIFKPSRPDYSAFFAKNQRFHSDMEGFSHAFQSNVRDYVKSFETSYDCQPGH